MSYADYKSDIARLTAELEEIREERARLERQISQLRPENLNRDALDLLAREKVFLSDPKELTIWLDP